MISMDLRAGARAMLPWLAGVAPFGLVIGLSAARASAGAVAGWLSGIAIYAGSAQLATIQLIDAGAGPLAVVLTVVIINLRLVLYAGALAPYWRGTPLWWRLLGGYLLVDPSFAVGIARYAEEPDRRRAHAHYLGGAVVLWFGWLTAILVGATIGARVPAGLHLELLVPLFMLGELASRARRGRSRIAAVAAAIAATLTLAVPLHLGVLIGIATGLIAAVVVARGAARSREHPASVEPVR
jgi:predicted branched-subunit amino acid permease